VGEVLIWLQPYRPFFEVINACGSLLAVITWLIAIPLILRNWWRGKGIGEPCLDLASNDSRRMQTVANAQSSAMQPCYLHVSAAGAHPSVEEIIEARPLKKNIGRGVGEPHAAHRVYGHAARHDG
jgi:hypothetical protein